MELDGTRAYNKESFSIFEWECGVINSRQGDRGCVCVARCFLDGVDSRIYKNETEPGTRASGEEASPVFSGRIVIVGISTF
jgi:hypothetical protein